MHNHPFDTPDAYIKALPDERKQVIRQLREALLQNLPEGFEETMSYGMIAYVVPHRIYPEGYHSNPKQPLPFINIASQKQHIALYHMGLYSDPHLMTWFLQEYPKHSRRKPDIGKSCIRFKQIDEIPYELIAQLATKMKVREWIHLYEKTLQR